MVGGRFRSQPRWCRATFSPVGSAGILIHVADLAEALGSATRAADLAGVKVQRLARWAAESPWLLAELDLAPSGETVADAADLDRARIRGPFASADEAIEAAEALHLPLAMFGPSLGRLTVTELQRVRQAEQRQKK